MNPGRALRMVVLVAASLGSAACGSSSQVQDVPSVSGPAPALDGTWDFTIPRGTTTCLGEMSINGSTGSGTFSTCPSLTGSVAGSVSANGEILLVFRPANLEAFWVRGAFFGPTEIGGLIFGPNWNGQQQFLATHR
ncbi:MAG: hypothetical protein WCK73_10620 [Deltaproteobacteria bacterium]